MTSSNLPACEYGTECYETSAYKIQMLGNYLEESIQQCFICLKFLVGYVKDGQCDIRILPICVEYGEHTKTGSGKKSIILKDCFRFFFFLSFIDFFLYIFLMFFWCFMDKRFLSSQKCQYWLQGAHHTSVLWVLVNSFLGVQQPGTSV